MAQPVIDYRGQHGFACRPEDVWSAIEQVERFERWWPWLQDFRLEGDGLAAGTVLHGVVAPPLPYRMRVRVELTTCVRPEAIDAVVAGDLTGVASLALRPAGEGSVIDAAWTVEMMQAPMRLASRVAYPLVRWGHDRVVEVTVARFRRYLAAGA
ncbi:MAG TPA: SRPBCC family protein [Acidimicrobiales bacterium]|jgi:carbon monoxide dehydrogenase subunit G